MYLDADQKAFIQAMRDAVLAKGEGYVYANPTDEHGNMTCLYVANNAASCIVGKGIVNSGIMTADELSESEGKAAAYVLPWGENDPVSKAAGMAQSAQDAGKTWGYAYGVMIGYLTGQGYKGIVHLEL